MIRILLILPVLFACTSKSSLENELADLRLKRDSLNYHLSGIDTLKTTALFSESMELKSQLKLSADTLTFEEAGMLSKYFNNLDPLEDFSNQVIILRSNLDSAGIRLEKLTSDIEKQAGDRSEYKKHILAESRELDLLSEHVRRLLAEQQKANEAAAQFKEPIVRFIRRFAVP